MQVGDRLRLKKGSGFAAMTGAICTIVKIEDKSSIQVVWKRNDFYKGQMDGIYDINTFELVDEGDFIEKPYVKMKKAWAAYKEKELEILNMFEKADDLESEAAELRDRANKELHFHQSALATYLKNINSIIDWFNIRPPCDALIDGVRYE